MPRTMLKDEHWTRLRPILLELNIYDKGNLRCTVEGVLYRMRVGCPWRDLPAYFGKPNTVYKAYQCWFRSNKLIALFGLLIKDSDCEGYDSEALRAHIKQAGCFNNIPRKQNTKSTNNHMDWHLYKTRHLVENAFAKLKNYSR
ncbi:probable transposase ISSod6 [Psychrobacter arcticus 273-4]|uniref:Probable transposase ISSod6 n=1 Tax=Psychrobacter arcticus (strain DSM 17307 / VKM B-2377 / 273-4) TaxID=259536 RepID=Q4FUM2_PSYA2|nr:probable transposase ISSod6 [Psychrobacter arcticus 273-4]